MTRLGTSRTIGLSRVTRPGRVYFPGRNTSGKFACHFLQGALTPVRSIYWCNAYSSSLAFLWKSIQRHPVATTDIKGPLSHNSKPDMREPIHRKSLSTDSNLCKAWCEDRGLAARLIRGYVILRVSEDGYAETEVPGSIHITLQPGRYNRTTRSGSGQTIVVGDSQLKRCWVSLPVRTTWGLRKGLMLIIYS